MGTDFGFLSHFLKEGAADHEHFGDLKCLYIVEAKLFNAEGGDLDNLSGSLSWGNDFGSLARSRISRPKTRPRLRRADDHRRARRRRRNQIRARPPPEP
jgi:hypothetical protein